MSDTPNSADQPSDEEYEAEAKRVQQALNYFNSLKEVAASRGYVILESWKCPKCGIANLYSHMGTEVVPCVNCGHHHATIGPRVAADGEIGVMHYILALKMLRDVYGERAKELPPLADHEIMELAPEIRMLLARHRGQVIVEAMKKLDSVAEELAGLDGTA